MKTSMRRAVVFGLVALAVGFLADRAGAQAAAKPHTLWQFLGFPSYLRNRFVNQHGFAPGLEKKPPLRGIADPSNLESDVPAIQKAAEVKQQEDLAKQKIKAIRYLTDIGCGCYDKDGSISDALVAAMDDCTEKVRLVTVRAIGEAAKGGNCAQCNQKSCCNEKIVKQLAKIAYERDDKGCWLEPSQRVREAAVEALGICCPNPVPAEPIEEVPAETPEGPTQQGLPEVPEGPNPSPEADTTTQQAPSVYLSSRRHAAARGWTSPETSAVRSERADREANGIMAVAIRLVQRPKAESPSTGAGSHRARPHAPRSGAGSSAGRPGILVQGVIHQVDFGRGLAVVHLGNDRSVAIGSHARIYHDYLTGRALLGVFEVVRAEQGTADLRPLGHATLEKVGRGDPVFIDP